jgi:hypothetical protein
MIDQTIREVSPSRTQPASGRLLANKEIPYLTLRLLDQRPGRRGAKGTAAAVGASNMVGVGAACAEAGT